MKAEFRERNACVCCGSSHTKVIAEGSYDDDRLHGFLAADPWGVSPLPALRGARWRLLACDACHMRFHGLILTPEWRMKCLTEWMSLGSIVAFERDAGIDYSYQFRRGTLFVGHVHSLQAMMETKHPPIVLDFGCGSGEFLAQAALHGMRAFGVDASSARRSMAGGHNVDIFAALQDLPGDLRGAVNAITLFEVLEHLDDPRAMLETLREWIAPDGILILETPDAGHVSDIQSLDDYRAIHPLDHLNAFSRSTLVEIARRSGFKRIDRQFAFTSTSVRQSGRKEARRLLDKIRPGSTQQYFRAA